MARLIRLLSPGIAFFGLGVIVLLTGKWPWFHLRGGLVTVGLYSLALQIVLTALLISAIPDRFGRGLTFGGRRVGRGAGEIIDIGDQPISFSRALVEFYRRPFLPVFLLGFGLGASLSALIVGSFHEDTPVHDFVFGSLGMRGSEAVLGAILVLGAVLVRWRGGHGYFGWTIGMGVAIVLGQVVFVLGTNARETIVSWGSLVIGLCLLRLLVHMIMRVQRAEPSVAPDGDSISTGETLHTRR